MPTGVDFNAQGGDFSKWDGGPSDNLQTIDFEAYAAALDFALIKVSEGLVEDPLFRRQWPAARGRIVRAPYSFFRSSVDQERAAQRVVEILGSDAGEIEAALDLEVADGSDSVMSLAHAWTDEYHRLTGLWPIIYSTDAFLREHGAYAKDIRGQFKNEWLAFCKLWLAEWPFDELKSLPGYTEVGDALRAILIQEVIEGKRTLEWPKANLPFTGVTFWQWTSRYPPERVPGYYVGPNHKLAVDMNFHGLSREAFRAAYPIGGQMDYAYKAVPNVALLNLRADHSTASTDVGDISSSQVAYGNELWGDGVQEQWLHVLAIGAEAKDCWIAIRHAGTVYCTLTMISVPPKPVTVTLELNDAGKVLKPKSIDASGNVVLG